MTDPHHTVPAEIEQHIQEAAGHIYQAVAQTIALAIEDATDALRNIGDISSTALGIAIVQYLESASTSEPTRALLVAQAVYLHRAVSNEMLRVVQAAGTAACVQAMHAEPENAARYEQVLAVFKRLV